MVKLWRCIICGDPYIGENPPKNCPFCGAHASYIKEAKDAHVDFDVQLTEKDRAHVEHALEVELSNASFYSCAAIKTDDEEARLLFKALAKIESEHATIWKKILKLPSVSEKQEVCSVERIKNIQESHRRETSAITFYREASKTSDNGRIRQIFVALVEVETDHLHLSEERL